MAKADSLPRVLTVKVAKLKRSTTREALELSVAHASSIGEIKSLKLGNRIAVLIGSTGFMALDYSVGVYEPRPLPFRPDRLKLVSSTTVYDEPAQARALYSELV
jgi:hypothetical protein